MLQVFHNANFPMMGRTKLLFFAISTTAFVVSVGTIMVRGFNYGIDFAGGTAVQLRFVEAPQVESMRAPLEKAGLGDISIQQIGERADHEVLIRVESQTGRSVGSKGEGGEVSTTVIETLRKTLGGAEAASTRVDLNLISEPDLKDWFASRLPAAAAGAAPADAGALARAVIAFRTAHGGLIADQAALSTISGLPGDSVDILRQQAILGPFTVRSVEFVGPTAGKELLQNTLYAVFGSVVGILLYVWLRFHKWMWGLTSVIALVHDVVIAAGAVSLTGKEFSLPVVAALLTILGYSINDTIVVFDRIRENLRLYRDRDFEEVVNASVNQTLSRTILTSFTVFIAITALYLYGGEKLDPLSFCL
ncbi:MAG TPA: protein translocase subunit SecF, partial [Candidatus Polarisedimenticolia bacterium]